MSKDTPGRRLQGTSRPGSSAEAAEMLAVKLGISSEGAAGLLKLGSQVSGHAIRMGLRPEATVDVLMAALAFTSHCAQWDANVVRRAVSDSYLKFYDSVGHYFKGEAESLEQVHRTDEVEVDVQTSERATLPEEIAEILH